MTDALADAYDSLMDHHGSAPVLTVLARESSRTVIPLNELLRAAAPLGGPQRLGALRDLLMSLQPLLLRVNPGAAEEMVGFRHPSIAAHVLTRDRGHVAVQELELFFDHELPLIRRNAVADHLDDCSNCMELAYGVEGIKSIVARRGGGDRAPDALRDRIFEAVRHEATVRQGGPDQESTVKSTPSARHQED